jgi:hypothetical protein
MKTQHAVPDGDRKVNRQSNTNNNQHINKPISKRSKVMNAVKFFRAGLLALLTLVFGIESMYSQGVLKNGGVFRNTGNSTFKEIQNYKGTSNGTIVNSGTLSTTTAAGGSGKFRNTDGSARAGTVRNYIGGIGNGTAVVADSLFTNFTGATFDNDSSAGLSTLRIAGGLLTTGGTFDTDSGRVWYNGGTQTIVATTYGVLVTDNSGTKTLADSIVVRDSLRIDNGSTLAVSTFRMNLLGATNVAQNTGTLSAGSGTVRYAGDLNQSIIPTQYKVLTLTGSTGARTKTSAGGLSFASSGQLTVDTNDTLFVSSGNLDLSTNSPTLINSSAIKLAGDATFHGGISNAGNFYYAGTSAQAIGGTTYANLRLGGSGGKNFPSTTVAVTGNYSIDAGTGTRNYSTGTFQFAGTSTQTISGLSETFYILQFAGSGAKNLSGTSMGAARLDILGTSGVVTNDVTTVTLTNVSNISLTIASGRELVNNAGKTITMNGDLENDGIITNAGTISVN